MLATHVFMFTCMRSANIIICPWGSHEIVPRKITFHKSRRSQPPMDGGGEDIVNEDSESIPYGVPKGFTLYNIFIMSVLTICTVLPFPSWWTLSLKSTFKRRLGASSIAAVPKTLAQKEVWKSAKYLAQGSWVTDLLNPPCDDLLNWNGITFKWPGGEIEVNRKHGQRDVSKDYLYLVLHVCFSHAVKLEGRWCGELV